MAFLHVTKAQMDFSFQHEKVAVLKVEEHYSEASKDKRPIVRGGT